ncbi:MAG: hypothetical protein OXH66_00670 [Gemmatimonadetes bacterium]|nr:hypothetical protein [Gemmatimonadota bacterium]
MKATLGFLLFLAVTLAPLGGQVALEEVRSAVLPFGFRPVGMAVGQESIFVWGAEEGSFLVVDEQWHVTEHRLEAGRIRAVEWDGQYWQIMLDTGGALTLSAALEVLGGERTDQETESPPQASAMWREGGWHVLRVGSDGILRIDGIPVVGSAGLGPLLSPADHIWVRRTGKQWVVAKLFPPFWAATVDPEQNRVRTVFETIPPEYSVTDGRPPRWVAMPVIPLGSHGFLQVVSDLRSSDRMLFRFSADGAIVGRTVLASPVAFVASEESGHRLWGVRSLDRMELVEYNWRGGASRF